MADSTLVAIRSKVRKLTRRPSTAQITDEEIDEYVNTFIQYDFPSLLRLFTLRTTLKFYTQPNVDEYGSQILAGDPLQNFNNVYISIHEPVYIGGYRIRFTQSRDEFYSVYPLTNTVKALSVLGDGVTFNFAGTLTTFPVLRGEVLFTTVSIGDGVYLQDNGDGLLNANGSDGTGTIDYETGAFTLSFNTAPDAGESIFSQTIIYQPSRPQFMLYFNNSFFLRPVPDKVYPVSVEVYRRPTEILNAGDSPELEQWWEFIVYGATKKIFEDSTDMESVQRIMPEFEVQKTLVERKTLSQLSNQRSYTIYTNQSDTNNNFNNWNSFF